MRRAPRPLPVLLLCAGLLLCACGRQQGRDAEVADLRARLERLEREQAEERERLSADVASLRAALDEANRTLETIQEGEAAPPAPHPAAKSPRAELRASLRGMWDASRQAVDRLSQSLERSLSRPKPAGTPPPDPQAPARDGGN